MTNLPISNANILPTNNGAAPLASAQEASTEQGETPFASLLAQQIDGPAIAAGAENAQTEPLAIAAAEDIVLTQAKGDQPTDKDGGDIVQDAGGTMAALFLQLPERPATVYGELNAQGSKTLTHAAVIALEKASPHSRLAREALAQAETISPSADSHTAKPANLPQAEFSAQPRQTVAQTPADSHTVKPINLPQAEFSAQPRQTVAQTPADSHTVKPANLPQAEFSAQPRQTVAQTPADSHTVKPTNLPQAEFSAQPRQTVAQTPADSHTVKPINLPQAEFSAQPRQTVAQTPADSHTVKPANLPQAEFSAQPRQSVAQTPADSRKAGPVDMQGAELIAQFQQTVSAPIPADIASVTALAHISENAVQTPPVASFLQAATSTTTAPDPQKTIATPLTSEHWPDDFSQKINWMVTQKNQIAELHLNPPDLGPLNVVLRISENQATALFTSPHSAVREAVENAMPKLREMLADNGIMLGNATVSDQSLPDRSAKGFADRAAGMSAVLETPENIDFESAAPVVPMRRHNGMVDTFA